MTITKSKQNYCGVCVMTCPSKWDIRLVHPLMNQARFVPIDEDQ